jgi:hypothetical protein
MTWPYIFIFPGGSGGMFLKTIFYYYLTLSDKSLLRKNNVTKDINLDTVIDSVIGHCHNNIFLGDHFHDPGKIDTTKSKFPESKIVYIRIEQDDILPLSRMIYFKFAKSWIKDNIFEAESKWLELKGAVTDQEREQRYFANLSSKVPIQWLSDDTTNADFVIDFKTIYGRNDRDLHQIVVDYLKTIRLPEIDKFILRYRIANEKYFV